MAKVNAKLREKLLGQKKQMGGSRTVIDNKSFEKMRFRLLPIQGDELPGQPYYSFYCPSLPDQDSNGNKLPKGPTSPKTFGLQCLVWEALDDIYQNGTDEDKEFAKKFVSRSTEYWLAGIDRNDEGTVGAPRFHILRGKQSVYSKVVDWLVDEDIGEDITDAVDGRDLLIKKVKTGQRNTDVEWKTEKLDPSPIHHDKAFAEAMVDGAKRFDLTRYFYGIHVDQYERIYEGLTGDPLPADYKQELFEAMEARRGGGQSDSESGDDGGSDDEETSADGGTPSEEEGGDDDWIGKRVEFDDDDGKEKLQGEVVGIDDTDGYEGNLLVAVDDDDGDPYSLPVDEVEAIEEEEEETAPEPEPEPEAEPQRSRRRRSAPAKKDEGKAKAKAKEEKPKASSRIRDRMRRRG